ncbi:MAG: glycosyltransferase family 2 protein [Candidatus Margulisiibacteriota bacterium]
MIGLSVIIVCRNNLRYLPDCLASLHQSFHRLSFEVILVDNSSTDESLAFVRNKFPAVKVIANRGNFGFSRANNQGLKLATGRYVMLLNADTITKNNAIEQLVDFLDTHPSAGAAAPKLLNIDGTVQRQGGAFSRRFWLAKEPVQVDFAVGAALVVRKEVVDRVGGLDENFFFANDDLDWCLRIRQAGWPIYFLPQVEIIHYGGYTIKKFNPLLLVEGWRGGLYFARKHYGWLAYQLYRWLLVLAMLLAIPCFVLFDRPRSAAFRDILFLTLKGEIKAKYEENTVSH